MRFYILTSCLSCFPFSSRLLTPTFHPTSYFHLPFPIPQETFDSLHVFKRERHPSAVKTTGKEGFSLYGVMMGNCKSRKGVKRLKEWLCRYLRADLLFFMLTGTP